MDNQNNEATEVSLGKTLLGNWVEERHVAPCDEDQTIKNVHIGGHSGILTQTEAKATTNSTSKDSYIEYQCQNSGKKVGKRQALLEKELYERISKEVENELNAQPAPVEYKTTTKSDFTGDYTPTKVQPTREHDVNKDQATTFWSENLKSIHGVTEVTADTPFKKNTSFSTPISEYKDTKLPGDKWQC